MLITVTFQRSKRISTNMNIITSSLDISHYHDSCYYRWITIFIFSIFYYFYFLGRLFPDHPEFSVPIGVLEWQGPWKQDGDARKTSYFLVLLRLLACCLFWGSFLVAVVGYFCCFDLFPEEPGVFSQPCTKTSILSNWMLFLQKTCLWSWGLKDVTLNSMRKRPKQKDDLFTSPRLSKYPK